jgi:formylmethanofuran dehydrogenase subunit C
MTERQTLVLPVPEVRDYARINAQVARWLDVGHRRIVLAGVSNQRLLLAGLRGPWSATIEVQGDAGPELGAGMDAPGVVVTCLGNAADAAGGGLRGGTLRILGDVADCLGYRQRGGRLLAAGSAGHRAGLELSGGLLLILGNAGRLCGERQHGGRLIVSGACVGPHAGFGRDGGLLHVGAIPDDVTPDERAAIDDLLRVRA